MPSDPPPCHMCVYDTQHAFGLQCPPSISDAYVEYPLFLFLSSLGLVNDSTAYSIIVIIEAYN